LDILDILAITPPFVFGSAASADSPSYHPAHHTIPWTPRRLPWQPVEEPTAYRHAGRIEIGFEGAALVAFQQPGSKQSRRRQAAKARAPKPSTWLAGGSIAFGFEIVAAVDSYNHLPAILAADEVWLAKMLSVSEEN